MFPVDTERNINLSKHSIMNKTKQGYVAPLSDLLVVRFEENIMSPAYGAKNEAGADMVEDGAYTYDY